VPTDCPQRDERMGWMGDAQVFAQSAIFEMDMAAFYTKWIQDIRDAQAKDGSYPDIAPHGFDPDVRFKNAPGWADAGIIVPWRLYENYADQQVLRDHIDSAKQFIDGLVRDNPDLIWKKNTGNNYGDWLNGDSIKAKGYPKKGGELDKEIFATAFFAHSTSIVSQMCAVLGLEQDAARYRDLAEKITRGWRAAYVDKDGRIKGDTQAGYALALHFGLLPDAQRAKAVEYLAEGVKKYDNRISTGFHSTYRMMLELSRGGQHELACALAQSKRFPSWGYTVEQGATTIWERWDGYVAGRGFQDVGMNSFSHYAIGAVTEWMYRTLAGINQDDATPAYKQFVLHPKPGGSITSVNATYDSIRGPIGSDWKLDNREFQWKVRIPANTVAEVYVPGTNPDAVSEGAVPAAQAMGLKFLRVEDGACVYRAASGYYHFRAPR
jgi:alpha-L-rhamnosidase